MWAVTYPKEGTLDGAWALWRVLVGSPRARGPAVDSPHQSLPQEEAPRRDAQTYGIRPPDWALSCMPSVWVPGQGGDWAAAVTRNCEDPINTTYLRNSQHQPLDANSQAASMWQHQSGSKQPATASISQ